MPFTGPIEDRLAVRELYGTYSGAGFAGDRAAWLECWTSDPVWDTPHAKGEGTETICAIWDGLWSGIEVMAFSAEIVSIEVQGDRARSSAYCREVSNWKDGKKIKIIGRYDDDLVHTPSGWRFQRRKFTMHIEE